MAVSAPTTPWSGGVSRRKAVLRNVAPLRRLLPLAIPAVLVGGGCSGVAVHLPVPGAPTPGPFAGGADRDGPYDDVPIPPLLHRSRRSLPDAPLGVWYEHALEVRGDKDDSGPYVWTLVEGKLPEGLRMTENGVIYGIPRGLPDTWNFTVRVSGGPGTAGEGKLRIRTVRQGRRSHASSLDEPFVRWDTPGLRPPGRPGDGGLPVRPRRVRNGFPPRRPAPAQRRAYTVSRASHHAHSSEADGRASATAVPSSRPISSSVRTENQSSARGLEERDAPPVSPSGPSLNPPPGSPPPE